MDPVVPAIVGPRLFDGRGPPPARGVGEAGRGDQQVLHGLAVSIDDLSLDGRASRQGNVRSDRSCTPDVDLGGALRIVHRTGFQCHEAGF